MSISANNLTIGYGSHVVQRNLNFSLRTGEMVAMLGRNGCGKSTLLRTLVGMQAPLDGSITLADRTSPAVVLTEHDSIDRTTIHDIVAMGRYPYTNFLGGLSDEDERIIAHSLELAGMPVSSDDCSADAYFAALSSGQQQRVLIAKALAQQTTVILLDEPTSHLDIPGKQEIFAMLRRLATEEGKTILISTHEQDLALRYCDRILMMYARSGGITLTAPEEFRPEW